MQAVILFLFAFFLFPASVLAAPYGESTYGCGPYGTGCSSATATPTPNPSSSSSGGNAISNAISTFFCTNQAPSSAPNLFQINTTSTMATLYFAPAGSPYDSYMVSFGSGVNDEGNGVQFAFSNAKGAIDYQVNQLAPSSVYTFKIRGQNGCKPGPWSSDLTIKTQAKGSKSLARFYPNKQASVKQQKQTTGGFFARIFSQATPTPSANPKPQKETKPQSTSTFKAGKSEPAPQSFWGNIMNFFSGLHY